MTSPAPKLAPPPELAPAVRPAPSAPPKEPALERLGVRYLRRLATATDRLEPADAVHFLNPEERAGLRRVQRGAVIRAAVAGAISTALCAAVEVAAPRILGIDLELARLWEQLPFWLVLGAVTAAASALEIAFLYWDGLRSVRELTRVAGLDLTSPVAGAHLTRALARAALELPNPAAPVFGINPLRGASKARLVAAALVYKAKIAVSTFVAKLLVRRVLGRAALRTLVPFVAVPVTAAWNGVVCWLVLRQARLRAMGPSAAEELAGKILEGVAISPRGKTAAFRAVGCCAVAKRDLHPNLVALLEELRRRLGEPAGEPVDELEALKEDLAALPDPERRAVLRLLAAAAVIDGRLTLRERRLIGSAREAAGLPPECPAAAQLRRALLRGDGFEPSVLEGLS